MDPDSCFMHFTTVQSTAIKGLFETLQGILHDTNMVFTPAGAKIAVMDGSKVTFVYMFLPAEKFEAYKCVGRGEFGMNMLVVYKFLKQADLHADVEMYVEHNSHFLYIVLSNRDTGDIKYKYKLLDLDSQEIHFPPVEFDSVVTMPSAYFQKQMRAMKDIGDNVTITYQHNNLIFTCEGSHAEQTTTIKSSDGLVMQSHDTARFSATFPLRFLELFSKASTLCTTMEMHMKQGYPLVLKYSVACLGELKFCLASRHEGSDDEDDMEDD